MAYPPRREARVTRKLWLRFRWPVAGAREAESRRREEEEQHRRADAPGERGVCKDAAPSDRPPGFLRDSICPLGLGICFVQDHKVTYKGKAAAKFNFPV